MSDRRRYRWLTGRPLSALAVTLALSGAAPAVAQSMVSMQAWVAAERRVHNAAFRVLQSTVDLCEGSADASLGATFWGRDHYGAAWAAALDGVIGAGAGAVVVSVATGSPASRAGVRVGDELLGVDAWRVPAGEFAEPSVTARLAGELEVGSAVGLLLRRDGRELTLRTTPVATCRIPVVLDPDEESSAFSDGTRVVINRGLVERINDDDELAFVVAHEVAHDLLGHARKARAAAAAGAVIGRVLDVEAAASGVDTGGAYSAVGAHAARSVFGPAHERLADYLALYLVARAGARFEAMHTIWRHFPDGEPERFDFLSTHPKSAERSEGMRLAVREIRGKQLAGQPLDPEDALPMLAAAPPVASRAMSTSASGVTSTTVATDPASGGLRVAVAEFQLATRIANAGWEGVMADGVNAALVDRPGVALVGNYYSRGANRNTLAADGLYTGNPRINCWAACAPDIAGATALAQRLGADVVVMGLWTSATVFYAEYRLKVYLLNAANGTLLASDEGLVSDAERLIAGLLARL